MGLVFLSYSHIDTPTADIICSELGGLGVEYFRDVKDIRWGKSITGEVRDALFRSAAVLVILSPASLKSLWVPYELGFCTALNRPILPYFTHPSLDPPSYIADLKHVASISELCEFFTSTFPALSKARGNQLSPAKPDIRIRSRFGIVEHDREFLQVVVISVANHGALPVFIRQTNVITIDHGILMLSSDSVEDQPQSPKLLQPGERIDVFLSHERARQIRIKPASLMQVRAENDIGHEFEGDPEELREAVTLLLWNDK